jgi:hypothetical protein
VPTRLRYLAASFVIRSFGNLRSRLSHLKAAGLGYPEELGLAPPKFALPSGPTRASLSRRKLCAMDLPTPSPSHRGGRCDAELGL